MLSIESHEGWHRRRRKQEHIAAVVVLEDEEALTRKLISYTFPTATVNATMNNRRRIRRKRRRLFSTPIIPSGYNRGWVILLVLSILIVATTTTLAFQQYYQPTTASLVLSSRRINSSSFATNRRMEKKVRLTISRHNILKVIFHILCSFLCRWGGERFKRSSCCCVCLYVNIYLMSCIILYVCAKKIHSFNHSDSYCSH